MSAEELLRVCGSRDDRSLAPCVAETRTSCACVPLSIFLHCVGTGPYRVEPLLFSQKRDGEPRRGSSCLTAGPGAQSKKWDHVTCPTQSRGKHADSSTILYVALERPLCSPGSHCDQLYAAKRLYVHPIPLQSTSGLSGDDMTSSTVFLWFISPFSLFFCVFSTLFICAMTLRHTPMPLFSCILFEA